MLLRAHWGSWRLAKWAAHFFPMKSMTSAWFSSNQSLCLRVDGPKYSTALFWRVIHVAFTSFSSKRMVSIRSPKASTKDCLIKTSFNFVMFSRFGAFSSCGLVLGWTLRLSLEIIRWWFVQHYEPHIAFVTLTSRLFLCLKLAKMPVLKAEVHPRCLVASREAEYGVGD